MNQLGTVYATKRRRRNGKSLKPTPKDGVTKSNPSKRHRERLNAELDTLASLLPFEQNILSKLDRLSILRLSVSYLRTKSYFQVVMHKDKEDINTPPGGSLSHHHPHSHHHHARSRDLTAFDHTPLDGEMFLQALNGFLMILTCDGEVFFATHSIEGYLGFHQSDIVHQSVYELVHSEDREELQRQLMWNSFLPPESANMGLQDVLLPDNCHLLERSFTVRFRCLLDNTSGFLRLDIRGRVKVLHGQNRKSEEPPLALFAICTPFGPPSLLEIPQKEVMFKSKHKLDLALVSMDQRGKMLLGYSDSELASMGGYDLVHYDDLAYVASAHQELLKTGASGMIAYRFQTKDGQWQWLQTSSRLVYKNSKPDFVISTHRPLMEEEGRDLLGKRTMDFKVSYLDAGLPNSYFSDADQLISTPSNPPANSISTSGTTSTTPTRVNRRYKTQLRDFLSTCRTKRKLNHSNSAAAGSTGTVTPPVVNPVNNSVAAVASVVSPSIPAVDYISDTYNTMYSSYPPPAAATTEHSLSWGHSNFHNTLYPHNALDNRYLTNLSTENLFHHHHHHHQYHRPYYPEYQSYNGFLERPAYEQNNQYDKLYCQEANKYAPYTENRNYTTAKCLDVTASWPYSVSPSSGIIQPVQVMELKDCPKIKTIDLNLSLAPIPPPPPPPISVTAAPATTAPVVTAPAATPSPSHVIQPKMEEIKDSYEIMPRQTVLMWGANQINAPTTMTVNHTSMNSINGINSPSMNSTMTSMHSSNTSAADSCDMKGYGADLCGYSNVEGAKEGNGPVGGGNNNNNSISATAAAANGNESDASPPTQQQQHHNHHNSRVVMVL